MVAHKAWAVANCFAKLNCHAASVTVRRDLDEVCLQVVGMQMQEEVTGHTKLDWNKLQTRVQLENEGT